ncbi:MAG: DUF2752 domain-containing protein [Clostridia bacterium]|nr:DUF2752 domain-containing protein [Oscillospiraceae bacterium]MBQ7004892.1 DUF2752 domain-containing protein [Clostridia bacterium]
MKDYIFNFLKANKNLILIAAVFAPFYLTLGCPIRALMGISCPSCGMSRAVEALASLDFAAAFHFHPLVFLLPVAFALYLCRRKIPSSVMRVLCITALVLLSVVYVIRLASGSEVVFINVRESLIYRLFS